MNELLFLGFALLLFTFNLIAFRMGKVYLFVLIAIYSILMNIFVLKQFSLFGLMTAGGNELYGAIFLATDMLSEHYSKKESFRAIILGFLVTIVFVISMQILLTFKANEFDFAHEHLVALFTVTPRILIGSLLAYIIAQSLDISIYHYLKDRCKFLFVRNNLSTMIAQAVDTIVFTAVGMTTFSFLPWPGIFTPDQFWEVVFFAYIFKVIIAILDTPFLYLSYKFLPDELRGKKSISTDVSVCK